MVFQNTFDQPPPGLLTSAYLPIKEADWLLNPTKSPGSLETLSTRGVRVGKLSDPGAAEPNEPKSGGANTPSGHLQNHFTSFVTCKLLAAASRLTCRTPDTQHRSRFVFPSSLCLQQLSSPHCRPDFTEMFENRTRSTSSGASPLAVASDKRRRREQRVARRGDVQTGNVTGGGRRAKKHLFFYSSRESLSALILPNGTEATATRGARVRVSHLRPGKLPRSTVSRGKLCLGAGSELLKQSSADKHRVLSSRERTRA